MAIFIKLIYVTRRNVQAHSKRLLITIFNPRADGAKCRARVLIPPGYLHTGK